MQKTKILAHVADENSYRAFLRNLYINNENLDLLGTSVHSNLFEIYQQNKPDVVILPIHEYTQEFNDFIVEHSRSTRIVLFFNLKIDNKELVSFWDTNKVLCCAQSDQLTRQPSDQSLFHGQLYDSQTYVYSVKSRNDKIAVLLSEDDIKNNTIIGPLLYPLSNMKLVLFNSATYSSAQNVGFLNPPDLCEVLNSYSCLIDIDDKYAIEARVCNIDNIDINGAIADNIVSKKIKSLNINIEECSYDYYIKNTFLPKILKG